MKKTFKNFVGIDVSKLTLDVCLIRENDNSIAYQVFENNRKGLIQLIKWINPLTNKKMNETLFCFEHTGIYAMPLCGKLGELELSFAIVPALEIKHSIGFKRGKSDKTDAKAIAEYAMVRAGTIKLYQLPEKKMVKLKMLLTHRESLVTHRKQFHVAATEHNDFIDKEIVCEMNRQNKSLLKTVDLKIKETEKLMLDLIVSDKELLRIYNLLQSIPGIGPIIAAQLIACTRCFSAFDNSRQFACYAGVAPFKYRSGTSIQGKDRVSPFANKRIKSLLNLAALTAKKTDIEVKLYYERKLKEGKNPMLILNNIRNKLVARVFATVKRGTPYVPLMKHVA